MFMHAYLEGVEIYATRRYVPLANEGIYEEFFVRDEEK